jgi:hypothetical protein
MSPTFTATRAFRKVCKISINLGPTINEELKRFFSGARIATKALYTAGEFSISRANNQSRGGGVLRNTRPG